jgi:C-terminal peptidase prc
MLSTFALTLSLTLLAPHTSGLSAGPQDASTLVERGLASTDDRPVAEVLAAAVRLAAGIGDEASPAFGRALDDRLARADELGPRAQLFLCCARMQTGEFDRAAVARRLVKLLGRGEEEVGRGAIALLQDTTFRELKDKDQDELVAALRSAASNGDLSPLLRLDAAVALHVHGGAEGQRAGRREMMDFLASSDEDLRALAALTLARVGDMETPREELMKLARLPNETGALASAYLKQEDLRRLYDARLRKLQKDKLEEPAGKVETKEDLQRVERMIRLIANMSLEGDKHSRDKLIDAALDGMLSSLDEHSSYLPPKAYGKMEQDLLSAEYGGIGAYVGEDPDDRLFTITRPIYSGPAYKAGLHSDDKIVRIDDWPTFGPDGSKPTDEIIKRLKGKPGTQVKIYVWRRGMDPELIDRPTEDMAVVITRARIEIPPVSGQLLPGGIALVQLDTFSNLASTLLQRKLAEFKQQGMKAVILDLRSNSGGLLEEAVRVSNLFLPEGKLIVTTEGRASEPERKLTEKKPFVPIEMPIAVLVNRFSASASEIVSGAIQDLDRGPIIGQRSFGKGSVQSLLPIRGEEDDKFDDENGNGRHDSWEKLTSDRNGNGEFDYGPRARMTIARYLLPSGRSIHREIDDEGKVVAEGGVEPDDKVAAKKWDAWKLEEIRRIRRDMGRKIPDYVAGLFAQDKAKMNQLAECDYDDTNAYPGFDELYNALGTVLSAQDVRFLVRNEVRRKAQDERGAAFPDGDYQEDPQLQAAVRSVLERLGGSVEAIPQYAKTFEPKEEEKPDSPSKILASGLSDTARSDLRTAMTLLRSGKPLTAEQLVELERALGSVLDK